MFLGYTVLQLFRIHSCVTCNVISPVKSVWYFYIGTFCSMCACIITNIIKGKGRAFPLHACEAQRILGDSVTSALEGDRLSA
jgi:hypothetical protein